MRCNCHTFSRIHMLWLSARLIWLSTLMLSPAVMSDKTAADYFVTHLPGAPGGPLLKMHAGHVEVDSEHNGHLFFWHFANRHIANRQRTVIWLNGGPGCSSMDGVLMEIGPYRVREGGKLEYSNGSWDEFANLLFVDNPVGTGFSYVDTDSFIHELDVMANQFIIFLEKWFAMFPQYQEDDIYIAGESYAGQHIPYISKAILERNKDKLKAKWNLQGIMIGNGWISPVHQYLEYVPFAKKHFIQEGSDAARRIENQQAICTKALDDGGKDHVDSASCEQLLQDILKETKSNGKCVNMYDVRLKDSYPSCGMNWPPDLENVTPYLRRSDVISALHINPDKNTGWTECSGAVGENFKAKKSSPSVQLLPNLLKEISILLFSGDHDLICNHLGTEELIHNLEWNGAKGFELSPGTWAPRRQWAFEGEAAGMYQYARNLTYLLFYNSSHMVPFDYPRRTRDMLDRFIGVDIGIIGGTPTDSRIDGEKGPQTSVGGHPNSDAAEKAEHDRLEAATRKAYYKSGETVLVIIVIVAACGWGFYMWRSRDKKAKYDGLPHQRHDSVSNDRLLSGRVAGSDFFRQKRTRDVEAADFDETALEDLRSSNEEEEGDRYSVGGVSSDEDEDKNKEGRSGSTVHTS